MFRFRDSWQARVRVDVAFTDVGVDLRGTGPGGQGFAGELERLEAACGVRFARTGQVHGDTVLVVERSGPPAHSPLPPADGVVTSTPGVGLMVRAADCVPVVLADAEGGVVGVAHAGRQGMALDVVTRTVEEMIGVGAQAVRTRAWVGPHVCGSCYEVPEEMRRRVSAIVPESSSQTRWGTPALDIGAGVRAQLTRAGIEVHDVGGCTMEDELLHSHRRDAERSGRMAGLVWIS